MTSRSPVLSERAQRTIEVAIVACFLLSGLTGLLYEVLWGRYLSLFIGASTYAHTAVLATFMGGLALGNHLFGRRADEARSQLRLYAWLEIGIGVYCLLFPTIFPLLSGVYVSIGSALGPDSALTLPLKITLGAVSILFPTTLMGGTLPVISKFLVRSAADIGHKVGTLYFINTAGAVAGCFLGGFWAVEVLGLELGMIIAALLNLAIGALFLGLARVWQGHEDSAEAAPVEAPEVSGRTYTDKQVRVTIWVIAIAGGVTMLYELVWIRLVALVFGSSSQSFSVMLMTFISGIALGGFVVSRLLRKDRDALWWLAWCEIGVALSILAMLPLYERFPWLFASVRGLLSGTRGAYAMLQGLQVVMLFALMLIPTTLIGMALPLATRVAVSRLDKLGRGVGHVFSMNTLGTLLGASMTGLLLIPLIGLQPVLYLGVVLSVALGLALLIVHGSMDRKKLAACGAGLVGVAVSMMLVIGQWDYMVLNAGIFQRRDIPIPDTYQDFKDSFDKVELLYQQDGLDTTVIVFDTEGNRFLRVNGKSDASTTRTDMVTQKMLGHLPMLLHPGEPEDVFIVGLGSGVTAGAVLLHPQARATVAELSRAVVDAASLFGEVNRGVLEDPRLTLRLGDAKDNLLLDDKRYDVIISEPSNPWISGIANLFTTEFFTEVNTKLKPGGMLVQWLQFYALDDALIARTINTLRSVFPNVSIWRFTSGDLMLVASQAPLGVTPEQISARLKSPAVAMDLGPGTHVAIDTPLDLFAHQALSEAGVAKRFPGTPPYNSDFYPHLEFEAPRALFGGVRPRIIDRLDERSGPRARSSLYVRRILGESVLDTATVARMARLMRQAEDDALPAALAVAQQSQGEERFERAISGGRINGLLEPRVEALLASETVPSPDACLLYSEKLASHYTESTTVFWQPPTKVLETLAARCVEAHANIRIPLHALLSITLHEMALSSAALDAASKGLALSPPPEIRIELLRITGRSALELGQRDRASKAYEALLKLVPGDAESRAFLKQPR